MRITFEGILKNGQLQVSFTHQISLMFTLSPQIPCRIRVLLSFQDQNCPISVSSYATNLVLPAGWQSITVKPDKCNLFEQGLVLHPHIIDGSVSLLYYRDVKALRSCRVALQHQGLASHKPYGKKKPMKGAWEGSWGKDGLGQERRDFHAKWGIGDSFPHLYPDWFPLSSPVSVRPPPTRQHSLRTESKRCTHHT